jgi:hypothetical protein
MRWPDLQTARETRMPGLETWAETGWTAGAALEAFDRLPPATLDDMTGSWRGSELPTGHPLDGLLALYDWRGKRFGGAERVDPLVFSRGGGPVAIDPGWLPLGLALSLPRLARTDAARALFRLILPLIATRSPKARLRRIEHRGQVSAAMIYDDLPIIDHFRRVDDTRRLGLMDLRLTPEPFFFLLTREV